MIDEIEINLALRPLTYNQYYRNSKSGRRVKTGAGLAYDEELGLLLAPHHDKLKIFGQNIDPSNHVVIQTICHGNTKFYIQDGSRLNKKSGDSDGIIKVLQDALFDIVGVDDYIIKDNRSIQMPHKGEDYVYIHLKIMEECAFLRSLT